MPSHAQGRRQAWCSGAECPAPRQLPIRHCGRLLASQPHPACPRQGDTDAHKFYVMERGAADVHIFKEEWGEERPVLSYGPGRWAPGPWEGGSGRQHTCRGAP